MEDRKRVINITIQQIKEEIKNYITSSGGSYSNWYVGVASDPRARLFTDHAVQENGDYWIYQTADSSGDARDVEEYFLNLGCDGGTGGGDSTTKSVYAYKKNSHTNP